MPEQSELRVCPFCGNKPQIKSHQPFYTDSEITDYEIFCDGPCEMKTVSTGKYTIPIERAIQAWNERASDE